MSKIILMQGLPASGKSTKAKEIMKAGGDYVRLNKDLLREMLHFGKYSGSNERIVIDLEQQLAFEAIRYGKSVIVDDTNLNPHVIREWFLLAKGTESKFEIVSMDTSWQECLGRDVQRGARGERFVGQDVIVQMAMRYELMGEHPKHYVISDLDGTLADVKHRLHFLYSGEKKDWKGFFEASKDDTFRNDVFEQINTALGKQDKLLVIVSARPEEYRKETEQWLAASGVSYLTLIMRKKGDTRDDQIVKQEILDRYFPDKSKIYKVFDDRPRVIRMWRENGLDVVDVGEGIEF